MDFDEYRRLFYFFQYHFYVRSKKCERDILRIKSGFPKRTLLSFLHELMLDPDEAHVRWELRERGRGELPSIKIRRPPRGMKNAEAIQKQSEKENSKPQPLHSSPKFAAYRDGKVCKIFAEGQSIRHRFMLSDWLKTKNGKKWNNFADLYRPLIVLDLCRKGKTLDEIADDSMSEYFLFQMTKYREQVGWEDAFSSSMSFGSDPPSPYDLNNQHFQHLFVRLFQMTKYRERLGWEGEDVFSSLMRFGSDPPSPCNLKNQHLFVRIYESDFDGKQGIRLAKKDIALYYNRALKLIELAETCNFKALPSIFSIKPA